MATISRNAYGNWKAVVRRKGWPTISKTFRTKRDAEDWSRTTDDEIIRGIYVPRADSERMTVDIAMDRYLKEVTPNKKKSTQVSEVKKAATLRFHLGNYSLAALRAREIASYRDMRLEEGKSANTVRLELALLSHLYNTAIREWGLGLVANPVSNIKKPVPGAGRDRRLIGDEENRLLEGCDKCSNPMLGWIVRIALTTAMRAGEIETLRRNQVDLVKRIVRLTETKNGASRTVPLMVETTAVFENALNHPIRPLDTDLVFWGEPGRDGKRRPYQFKPSWYRAVKAANISDLRFHDLRHEAISRLVESGLGDQEVAAISGHKSMQMLKRYTHLRAEDLVEKLDRLFP